MTLSSPSQIPPRETSSFSCTFALFLLFLVLGTACGSPPRPTPLEVKYLGCQAVLLPGPVCVVHTDRKLVLWVEAPPRSIEIRVDGKWFDVAGEPVQGGQRFSLKEIPAGAERLEVLVKKPDGQAVWSMVLTSGDVLAEVRATMRTVFDLIDQRQLVEARKALDGYRLPVGAPEEAVYLVSYYRGLLAEKEGDYRSALPELQEAMEVAERVNATRDQWMAGQELGTTLSGLGRYKEAVELFERLAQSPAPAPSPSPEGPCDMGQFLTNQAWSALLAREAGESFSDPLPLLESALATYESCFRFTPAKRNNLLLNLALAYLQEGRLPQAKNLLAQLEELKQNATLPLQLWWFDVEARIALLEGRPAEALRQFEDLEGLARETFSTDGRLRAAFGKAQAQEALGQRSAALETLRKADALLDEQSLQVPLDEGRDTFLANRQRIVSLHIEILLAMHQEAQALAVARHARSRMLRQMDRGNRLADLTPEERDRWEEILTEYHEKRSVLEGLAKDDWTLSAEQLRRALAARSAEAEAIQKLLDEAFLILGSSQDLSAEAPSPPRLGELTLAYQPLSSGWVGFAADDQGVVAHSFELSPETLSRPEEMARRLLLPFGERIERARRIRVLSSGLLQDVDFHALPFAGDILLASCPVVYGLDLPSTADAAPAAGSARRALLVADPRGDLPGALKEAQAVRKVLASQDSSWKIEELKAPEATAKAVQRRLPAADLFHYAGHGTFSGFGGWESSLLLSEETRLSLGDLLALDRVPAWVVLSACDTGRSSADTPVESLGLAHAFLVAGSHAVVASTRPADDRTVPEFFAELYRQWGREPDLAVALQRAQLSWRKSSPRDDWAGFRLFEP